MLRLNPGDNQGVRYILLNWLLAEPDRRNDVSKLLKKYDDASAEWSYGKSLHLFEMTGASKRATAALRNAIADNRHVPAYLMGTNQVPDALPASYGFGDDSKAILYSCTAISLWNSVPGAVEWLRSVAEGLHQGGNRGRRTFLRLRASGDRLKVYSDPCFPPGLRERIGTTERVPLRSPALEDAGDPRLDVRVQDAVPKLLLGRPGVGKEREREGEASNRHLRRLRLLRHIR